MPGPRGRGSSRHDIDRTHKKRDEPGNRNAALAAQRHRLDAQNRQAGGLGGLSDQHWRMGVAQRLAEDETLAVVALGGEGEGAAGGKNAGNAGEERHKRADIGNEIGGKHQVEAVLRLGLHECDHIAGGEPVIDAARGGALQHALREIEAGEPIDAGADGGAHQPGAAAEIERMGETALAEVRERRRQTLGRVITEALDQRTVEARGIIVEEGADIVGGHGFRRRRGGRVPPGCRSAPRRRPGSSAAERA